MARETSGDVGLLFMLKGFRVGLEVSLRTWKEGNWLAKVVPRGSFACDVYQDMS